MPDPLMAGRILAAIKRLYRRYSPLSVAMPAFNVRLRHLPSGLIDRACSVDGDVSAVYCRQTQKHFTGDLIISGRSNQPVDGNIRVPKSLSEGN